MSVFVAVPSVQADGTTATALINTEHIVAIMPQKGVSARSRIILGNTAQFTWTDSTDSVPSIQNKIQTAQYISSERR